MSTYQWPAHPSGCDNRDIYATFGNKKDTSPHTDNKFRSVQYPLIIYANEARHTTSDAVLIIRRTHPPPTNNNGGPIITIHVVVVVVGWHRKHHVDRRVWVIYGLTRSLIASRNRHLPESPNRIAAHLLVRIELAMTAARYGALVVWSPTIRPWLGLSWTGK